MKEKEIVMEQVMEVLMMVIEAVKETLYAEVTIVRSLVLTIMSVTIVVRNPPTKQFK